MNELATDIRQAFEESQQYLKSFPEFKKRLVRDVMEPRIGKFDEITYRHELTKIRDTAKVNGYPAGTYLKLVTGMSRRVIEKQKKKKPDQSGQGLLFNNERRRYE